MTAWPASLTQKAWLQASHTTTYAAVRRLSHSRSLAPAKQLPVRFTATAHTATVQSKQSMPIAPWKSLDAPRAELTLNFSLPTGQSFRWRRTAPDEFTGVVDSRVVKVRQLDDDVEYQVIARGADAHAADDAAALRNYFNLEACLRDLCQEWSERDQRYRSLHQYFPGARVLRQDPVECLFEFICSSNNHISRIHGMVERLCRDYGTPLLHQTGKDLAALSAAAAKPTHKDNRSLQVNTADAEVEQPEAEEAGLLRDLKAGKTEEEEQAVPDLAFYAFPTLEQLSKATEAALRAEGFGYRAKFITGSVAMLLAKPGGGSNWLLNLRNVPYREASEALCELPGVGPKVAACICLFALDKHEAIPVDTHVWQLAVRYYTPHLKGKAMNKKIMLAVEDAFIDKFGPWAGWAHNTLFISELASQQEHLPENVRTKGSAKSGSKKAAKQQQPSDKVDDQAGEGTDSMAVDGAAADAASKKRQRLSKDDAVTEGIAQEEPAGKKQKRASKVAVKGKAQMAVLGQEQATAPLLTESNTDKAVQAGGNVQREAAPKKVQQGQQRQRASKRLGKCTQSTATAAAAAVSEVLDEVDTLG